MKQLYIIIFLFIIFISIIGYAAKLDNQRAAFVSKPVASSDVMSRNPQETIRIDQQLVTFGLLIGAGLVGLLIVTRK